MSRYITISLAATGEHISTVDRPYQGGRIVNLNVGPLSLMLTGKDEEETEATLVELHDALTTLLAASRARRVAELGVPKDPRTVATDAAVYVAGGATPSEAVEWALDPETKS